ncbi:MAG: hypothetical protein K2Y37_13925 [Pirellulales bacterium]|nr:hypothetical protein [Pirellulales bacterium]
MADDKPLLFDEASRATRKARERRLHELACTFPALRSALRQDEWLDVSGLMDLAEADARCSSHHAARFILAVWSKNGESNETPFDAIAALTVWDEEHRTAFLAWASKPWFD